MVLRQTTRARKAPMEITKLCKVRRVEIPKIKRTHVIMTEEKRSPIKKLKKLVKTRQIKITTMPQVQTMR